MSEPDLPFTIRPDMNACQLYDAATLRLCCVDDLLASMAIILDGDRMPADSLIANSLRCGSFLIQEAVELTDVAYQRNPVKLKDSSVKEASNG